MSHRSDESDSARGKCRVYFEKRINGFFTDIQDAIKHRYPHGKQTPCRKCKNNFKCRHAKCSYQGQDDPTTVFKEFTADLNHGIEKTMTDGLTKADPQDEIQKEQYDEDLKKFVKEKRTNYLKKKKKAAVRATKNRLFKDKYGNVSDVTDDDMDDEDACKVDFEFFKRKAKDSSGTQGGSNSPGTPGTKDAPINLSEDDSDSDDIPPRRTRSSSRASRRKAEVSSDSDSSEDSNIFKRRKKN